MKSEEGSVLHVAHSDGRHAAREFCKYDGVEAEGLIRGHENAGRDEKNGEKRKGRGSCGRGARRRGRAVGEDQGLVLYFIAATLTTRSSSSNPKTVGSRSLTVKKIHYKTRVVFC